jgi:hypothetical protein
MPNYDSSLFDPPAPMAKVTVRNPETGASLSDVAMLIEMEQTKAIKTLESLLEYQALTLKQQSKAERLLAEFFSTLKVKVKKGDPPEDREIDIKDAKANLDDFLSDVDAKRKIPYIILDIIDEAKEETSD